MSPRKVSRPNVFPAVVTWSVGTGPIVKPCGGWIIDRFDRLHRFEVPGRDPFVLDGGWIALQEPDISDTFVRLAARPMPSRSRMVVVAEDNGGIPSVVVWSGYATPITITDIEAQISTLILDACNGKQKRARRVERVLREAGYKIVPDVPREANRSDGETER